MPNKTRKPRSKKMYSHPNPDCELRDEITDQHRRTMRRMRRTGYPHNDILHEAAADTLHRTHAMYVQSKLTYLESFEKARADTITAYEAKVDGEALLVMLSDLRLLDGRSHRSIVWEQNRKRDKERKRTAAKAARRAVKYTNRQPQAAVQPS